MTRTICFGLAAASWIVSYTAANLAAQEGAPPETAHSELREISPAEAKQVLAGFFAGLGSKPRAELKQPEWFPLDPKVQEWVDQVLEYWEERSEKVKTLEFSFQEWEYDPSYMPRRVKQLQAQGQLEKLPFARYSTGVMKYAAPEKGLFRVDQRQIIRAFDADGSPKYSPEPRENGTGWITDGKRFIMFDSIREEVLETQLPADMQGRKLSESGPFAYWSTDVRHRLLFEVNAKSLQDRFWIRPLQAEGKGEYCLELVPKNKQDAANFHSLQLVLDEEVLLPVKMQVFEYDWSPTNAHRTAYKFDRRLVNREDFDHRDFTEVKTPAGWRRFVRDANGNFVP
jgi:TIGR03009 family protein